jgi:outer membrane protein insertion porin family
MRTLWWRLPVLMIALSTQPLLASETTALSPKRQVDLSAFSEQTQEDLKKQFPFLVGGTPSRADLDNLIKYLVTQEQYETVQMRMELLGDTEVYHLNVGRTRRISSLSFTGLDFFSETKIRSELGINEKSVFDQQVLIEAGERVRRLYRDQGFRNTVIDLEFKRLSATEVGVAFIIKEGLQTKISQVDLRVSNPVFRDFFEKSLRKKLKDEPLTESLLNLLRKEMREAFSEKRFLKAELAGPEISLNKDESQADLTFFVGNTDQYILDYRGLQQKGRNSIESALELDTFYSTNPNIGPELATKVRNYYLSQGFARVEVSGDEAPGQRPNEKLVILDVKEGPQVKIKEVKFIGNYSGSNDFYVDFIKDHSTELVSKGYYNREGFQTGLNNVIIDRQNQGYLRAKILSSKTVYVGDKKDGINITVNLDEGPLTILQELTFEGNRSFSPDVLQRLIGLQAHEPLRLNRLEEGIGKLKEFYYNSGHLEMQLLNEKENLVEYNTDSTQASLHFRIYEGPKIIVSSILIEGNSLTQDSVINKELEFRVGDTLTPQLIEETTRRLQRMGHFNSVEIKTLEEKTQISQRTVVIRVTDRDPGLFTLGAGVNSEFGFTVRGYTSVAYRNIMGTGRGVSARLEGNYNVNKIRFLENNVTLGYLEPYLFNTRIKGRISYTLAEYVSDFTLQQGTQLKQITYSIEQDVTSHLTVAYDLWSSAQIRRFPLDPAENEKVDPIKKLSYEELVIVTTGPTLTLDYRDHPFTPTTGTLTKINAEYGSPQLGSSRSVDYWRGSGSFTHYLPVHKSGWVWANSLRGGYVKVLCDPALNPECGIPYNLKGLTLGGQSSIRGFLPDEAFPNKYDFVRPETVDSNGNTIPAQNIEPAKYNLTSSASMYLIKSELRFPIYGAIGGAVFYDGGAVYVKGEDFKNPWRDAVGLGMRYLTPIGSVSLDIGYKLKVYEDRHESQFPVYFSIGTF